MLYHFPPVLGHYSSSSRLCSVSRSHSCFRLLNLGVLLPRFHPSHLFVPLVQFPGSSSTAFVLLSSPSTGWFRELPIHFMMLIVGLILCQKFAPLERWCHFPSSLTDVRKRSGNQVSKSIVLRQSIKFHKPERGRGANLFLFR